VTNALNLWRGRPALPRLASALITIASGARQHAVILGGQPTLALAFENAVRPTFDTDRKSLWYRQIRILQFRHACVAGDANLSATDGARATGTFHFKVLYWNKIRLPHRGCNSAAVCRIGSDALRYTVRLWLSDFYEVRL
jgi:hypothetical protein